MIAYLKPQFKGKQNLIQLALILSGLFGLYLLVAWASYSPLDNAWTVVSTETIGVLNRTGVFGAWCIDLLYALFGKVAVIIPFTLCFSSVYLLFTYKSDRVNWTKMALRISCFLLFMLGIAGLATVLLSNSLYYASGGALGGLFIASLKTYLGLFGALLIAMLLTGIGFFLCSGQSIIRLLTDFYGWLTHHSDTQQDNSADTVSLTSTESSDNPLEIESDPQQFFKDQAQNADKIIPLDRSAPSSTIDTEIDESQMTDISRFTIKPQISGLITPAEKNTETVAIPIEGEFVDPKQFITSNTETLPTVNLQQSLSAVEQAVELSENFTAYDDPSHKTTAELTLPKVRLNVVEPTVQTQPLVEETVNDDHLANLAKEFEAVEQARLLEMESRAKAQGIEHIYQQIVAPETTATPCDEDQQNDSDNQPTALNTKAEPPVPAYPNGGYGESFIHPLLQRKTPVEKPTTPLPTLDLLDTTRVESLNITEQEIIETSKRIEKQLANFGVKATVEDVLVGPVVTRYEILPAAGVKASKITSIDSDLARALMFRAIRIAEVIPGKPFIGLETPNAQRQMVPLREVLDSDIFRNTSATLPMALGKDISGQPVVVDMAKMPHLLVAGQTGGGKSVGINTMILSLLFKLTPEQVRFIMIDPKVVELSVYNDIPHLLTPVVTDMKKAANALRWAVEEMERRYQLISELSVRNIEGYNSKIDQATAMGLPIPNPIWRPGDTMDSLPPPLEKLSYIVVIVDEFADLMMTAGKQIEEYIMRISQKARAVGIHLILATQRPSVDVITGTIKANVPSRIAFTVASKTDSRTILDQSGAESLLGRGDMLYSGAGSSDIIRIHGAFMSDDEVQRVADNWRARGKPNYLESIVVSKEDDNVENKSSADELDPLFDEVVAFILETNATSVSKIQRRFSIGFNRAARIVEQLEEQGILSAPNNRKEREILMR